MKKVLLILFVLCFFTSTGVYAQCTCKPACNCKTGGCQKLMDDDLRFYKNFADQVRKERSAVSNALQLTEEQAKCRVELIRENSVVLEEKFRKLYDENLKLKALKAENASKEVIREQEKNINCVKKEINAVVDKENKDFKKILDRQQRSKLSMIQKLQRKSIKAARHPKNYYKSNPKMRPFAMPKKFPCGCENN